MIAPTPTHDNSHEIFNKANEGLVVFEETTGAIVKVNPALNALLGYAEGDCEDKIVWEIAPFDKIFTRDTLGELSAKGTVRIERVAITAADGRAIAATFRATAFDSGSGRSRHVQCSVRDETAFSDRPSAEQERFRALVQYAPEAVGVYDMDAGAFVQINPRMEELFEGTSDELRTHRLTDFYLPEQPDGLSVERSFSEHMERAMSGELVRFERDICGLKGARRSCEVTLVRLPPTTDRMVRWTFIDTMERRRRDAELAHTLRALATLSNGTEALVDAGSESELFHSACLAIITGGTYAAAWVSIQGGDGQSATIAGATGMDPRACLAISSALTSVEPIACDLTADARIPEEQRRALARAHLRSFACVPILDGASPAGTLNVLAPDAGEFDQQAMEILMELSNGIAYAMKSLRERVAKESALRRLQKSLEGAIAAVAATVELRDPYTAGHQRRVSQLAEAIGREMGLAEPQLQGIRLASVVHDVGKIKIPLQFLTMPRRLTRWEFDIVKTHSVAGYEILKDIDFPWPIARIVLEHHEHLDGSGYPRGLCGDEILLESKIVIVADVVDAITSARPYRPALGLDVAMDAIRGAKGTKYDPAAVEACELLWHTGRIITDRENQWSSSNAEDPSETKGMKNYA